MVILNIGLKALIFILFFGVLNCKSQELIYFKNTSTTEINDFTNYKQFCLYDVNRDNYLDLIALPINNSSHTIHYFLNQKNQTPFVKLNLDSIILPGSNTIELLNVLDFNGDGNFDIVAANWYHTLISAGDSCIINPNNGEHQKLKLYFGDSALNFIDASIKAIEDLPPSSVTSLLCDDFNHDGKLDFFIGTWYYSWCFNAMPNYYIESNGADYKNKAEENGLLINLKGLFGATSTDWNNDGWNDILTCQYDTCDYGNLFKNNGDGTFTDVGKFANYYPYTLRGDKGQPVVPWEALPCDFDNDGDIDFALALVHGGTDEGEANTFILENTGAKNGFKLKPRYDIIIRKNPQDSHHGDHRLVWADFNNDGWADLGIADRGYAKGAGTGRVHICLQDPKTHKLIDIVPNIGLVDTLTGILNISISEPTSIEVGDLDMDGNEDLVISKKVGEGVYVLMNENNLKNNWIKIKLVSPPGVNSSCIGARVYVKTKNTVQIREITTGQGHFSGHSTTAILHYGIGKNKKIDEIIVKWPGNIPNTKIKKVMPNQLISIGKNGLIIPKTK